MRTRAIAATVLAAGLLLTACTRSDSDGDRDSGREKATKTTAPRDTTTTPTVGPSAPSSGGTAKDADEETIGVQDGTYEVTNSAPEYDDPSLALDDEYIAPGTYTTKGSVAQGPNCYWARMRDTSGETESIIANDLTTGRVTVKVTEGEFFKTSDCKPWTRSGD
ncbi:hypothetical protein HLK59_34335 [Streptomyces sp. S3(2020)]|uniref:hypothetical protein n=1 Tax=Streptomyces sp. S3(2020) TaxID=2732044 RepID=UPI001489F546|nr:hypothetical protein [Streptomyces sp. S3(2020)]NNN35361.1 hypothetical protein [Streptomyces sp. S3(2020)]